MVKNCGKGGKSHRKYKNNGFVDHSRELVFRDHEQNYAIVNDMLGHNRVRLTCFGDQHRTLGVICGKMRKKHIYRISKGDVVLISSRSFQDDKVDVIHVYTEDEKKQLIGFQEINDSFCCTDPIMGDDVTLDSLVFEEI